jgi:hypothetical protein
MQVVTPKIQCLQGIVSLVCCRLATEFCVYSRPRPCKPTGSAPVRCYRWPMPTPMRTSAPGASLKPSRILKPGPMNIPASSGACPTPRLTFARRPAVWANITPTCTVTYLVIAPKKSTPSLKPVTSVTPTSKRSLQPLLERHEPEGGCMADQPGQERLGVSALTRLLAVATCQQGWYWAIPAQPAFAFIASTARRLHV